MKKQSLMTIGLMVMAMLPMATTAQVNKGYLPFNYDWWWQEAFGLPAEWSHVPELIYNFIIPLVAIYTICFGFLRALRIFGDDKKIQAVLAGAMAFSTLPTQIFVTFVTATLGLAGIWAYVGFLAMFVVGVFGYTRMRVGEFNYQGAQGGVYNAYAKRTDTINQRVAHIEREIRALDTKLAEDALAGKDKNALDPTREKIKKLKQEQDKLQDQLETIVKNYKRSKKTTAM